MATINEIRDVLNSGNHAFLKELYGENRSFLKEKANDYINLVEHFHTCYGIGDIELFSAPGRTEIGGNHTDHQQGRVLAGAVNMDNIAVAAKNNKSIIQIQSKGYSEIEVDLNDLEIKESEFSTATSLVKGICCRLKELGYAVDGFCACILGGVPEGSGLSSSASFEVLIGAIISHFFNNGELNPVENAKVGQWAENNFFGKPSGLMDQTACAVGGFITIDFKDKESPEVNSVDFDFTKTGYSLVITNTGGSHANLDSEYALIPSEMSAVAKEFGFDYLRSVSLKTVIAKLPVLRKKVGDRALLRAIHFLEENNRVVKQVEALENNNFNTFLDLIIDSGRSSTMFLQNISPQTQANFESNMSDQSVALGLALSEIVLSGKGAWRVHGGGFAGTIQAFVPDNLLDSYISTLENAFGKGKCHKLFIRSKGAVKLEL